ncbi:MAG: BamA/TamA family outer membrane protein [Prevotella sp.]|nr:BamA/TamA family outer membrane protein [Prevotella sp.]
MNKIGAPVALWRKVIALGAVRKVKILLPCFFVALLLSSCSTTQNIPDGDQLFVGLTKINYERGDSGVPAAVANKNYITTQEEVEAALATAPNGALFGSSYHRTPFPYGLWIWNAFSGKDGKVAKWLTESFGKQPVLMSWVNPELRAQVAQTVLHNHGYFHGQVGYNVVTQRNPKKAKIGYDVTMGPLLTIDSISYLGFPAEADSLIKATAHQSLLHTGDAFTAAALDGERTRISTLFRNNGYYYYQPAYASYLADTVSVPGKAQLRLQLANGIAEEARRKYYIGNITVNLQKNFMQEPTDSLRRRTFTLRYNGKRSPVRPRVVMGAMRLRHRQPYSYDQYLESANALNATGLFSMTDFQFIRRDGLDVSEIDFIRELEKPSDFLALTSNLSSRRVSLSPLLSDDTLDLVVNCVFDRPYDVYFETNFTKRTIGRMGPELKIGFTKRNAFRGGEKLDVNLHGSYEWQTRSSSGDMNTYEYGADVSLEFPRLVAPFMGGNQIRRRMERMWERGITPNPNRWRRVATTMAKVSSDIVRRPGYYKMHIVSGEWTYRWQPSATSRHEFSPLTLKYQYMNSHTEKFDSIIKNSPYLAATMSDYFIPQMRYTYVYASPADKLNPIRWELTLSESGNLTSLAYMAAGKKWNEEDKKLFKNPYAQFVKVETDFTKTWQLSQHSQLVGHLNAGLGICFGNTSDLPFSERFYIGGANSVRAYPLRSIGPGRFMGDYEGNRQLSYLLQNGDVKLQANLEYRQRLFGNLHGAVFLDAGNVWLRKDLEIGIDDISIMFKEAYFRFGEFFKQMAVGTGVGLRYDLDFLILRLDWGIGLHVPYETTKSGFYNVDKFSRHQTLHFAIGYPF